MAASARDSSCQPSQHARNPLSARPVIRCTGGRGPTDRRDRPLATKRLGRKEVSGN